MIAHLFRAHKRLPPARWRPRRQQRRLVRPRSVRKHARPLLSLDASLLSATSVAPAVFTTHTPISLMSTMPNQAQVSTSFRSQGPVAQSSLQRVLLGWRAKVDLQPVLDCDAAIKYTRKYASKPETVSDGCHHALDDFCARMPQDLPAENAVWRFFAKMAADRDILTQEALFFLLGNHLVDACRLLRDHNEADDDDPAFEASFTPGHSGEFDGRDGVKSAAKVRCALLQPI